MVRSDIATTSAVLGNVFRYPHKANESMTYSVTCECGETAAVTAAQAGGTVLCVCGATLPVPKLSDLRKAAGQTAHRATAADRIAGMIARNELPDRDTCTLCDSHTNDVIWCAIVCERESTSDDTDRTLIYFLIFGWIAVLMAAIRPSIARTYGNDRTVNIPLRVCVPCLPALESTKSQSRLRDVIRRTPAYADLLNDYPKASVYPNCRG